MYEKFSTFLRLEVLSNNLQDFGLKKSLDNLETVRQTLATVTDRFAEFEAQALDVHVDFPLFQRLALPIPSGNTKIPGIKIQDTRMLRLMEVLLHRGTQLGGWRSCQIHQAILSAFQLTPANYTLTQLRYDLRKLKAHALLERDGSRYAYRLTDKGTRVTLISSSSTSASAVPWPTASSTVNPPNPTLPPANSKPLMKKPTLRSNKSSIYLPLEILRDKFSDLRFKNLNVLYSYRTRRACRQYRQPLVSALLI